MRAGLDTGLPHVLFPEPTAVSYSTAAQYLVALTSESRKGFAGHVGIARSIKPPKACPSTPPHHIKDNIMRVIPLATLLLLAGCSTTSAPPAIEIRTQRVEVPVAVACVDKATIPAEPPRVAGKLTGDARRDLDTVSASALRLRSWGSELRAMLVGCAK